MQHRDQQQIKVHILAVWQKCPWIN